MKTIGLLGYGKIGRYLFEHLKAKFNIAFVYDRKIPVDSDAAKMYVPTVKEVYKICREQQIDLVIEAAVPQLLEEMTCVVLQYCDVIGFSLTAFANDSLLHNTKEACRKYGHHFYAPHGAILGLDGIFDGRRILQSVTVTTTKRPLNLGRDDTERVVVYEGSTRGACALFPRNVNVHASIALAGLGFDKTISRIISDPQSPGNKHEVEAVADGCTFRLNVFSTSGSGVSGAYTPVSACSSIERILTGDEFIIA